MPQRHSKNNNDLAFFTYDEKRKLGYGTQKERLGKDSIKPFDVCCLCLKPFIEPMSCTKGHVYCKECILECLLAQKKDIQSLFTPFKREWFAKLNGNLEENLELWLLYALVIVAGFPHNRRLMIIACYRKQSAHVAQQKHEKEEEEERLTLQKARELDAFDQQNHGAVPQYNDKNHNTDKNGFHGANSVKTTSYEEEALRTMKAFWLPSATPEAPKKVDAPSTDTICPEGNEKLRLKTLFPICFTEDTGAQKRSTSLDKTYICPSCKVTLTNTLSLVALSSCGHVFCKKCADKFMAVDKVCLVCDKPCKERNLINLSKGGTGFAGHGDHLEAKDFKHLGSGSGLGLVRPAQKT
ncbi:nitric oxide synthase-interacting protein [Phtheirospermum japonicum]|uniref:Nitric oxide synthase-interacting protein n=1 Tax=Phtheirospermum japonicum TaxID=374723 RepID=A0A830BFB6_9LAMI|nr:nitric oxide synthase-interacting protein [Phtheirospermum japonicum]